jgi:hypothetical protein
MASRQVNEVEDSIESTIRGNDQVSNHAIAEGGCASADRYVNRIFFTSIDLRLLL